MAAWGVRTRGNLIYLLADHADRIDREWLRRRKHTTNM